MAKIYIVVRHFETLRFEFHLLFYQPEKLLQCHRLFRKTVKRANIKKLFAIEVRSGIRL